MTQKCPDCASIVVLSGRGDGKCKNCYGGGKVGSIVDEIAGAKPNCPKCHGTGQCHTCGGNGVVAAADPPKRPHANAELNPFDDKVAFKTRCPKCGEVDWFEWKFLGKLSDPMCGHTWYTDTGTYAGRQFQACFELGGKFTKYMSSGVGDGEGAWIGKALGYFTGYVFGIAFRLPFGVIMVPIQAAVRTSAEKKAASA